MNYIIFDDQVADNFYPLTLNRSVSDLRVGILKLRQRIAVYLEIDDYTMILPETLQELYRERHSDKTINAVKSNEYVIINSRLKIDEQWIKKIEKLQSRTAYYDGECFIAARCSLKEGELDSESLAAILKNLDKIDVEKGSCWQYVWELINENSIYIQQDFETVFYDEDNHYEVEPGVTILNPYNVWIGEGAELKPGVVIDASNGPVVIDENSLVMPNAVIEGPAYIGKNSTVKATSRIYEGTSIGPVCKVGGEIEGTIFQGYSNKQHDGFLGHSYIGEWVNIGANTNNSDLKNNYKPVYSYFHPHRDRIDTKSLFFGTVIGDHTKTAISTVINTGTIIGVGCNLIGNEVVTYHVPSFSWGKSGYYEQHRLDDFFTTCKIVKKRRKLPFTDAEIKIYKDITTMRL